MSDPKIDLINYRIERSTATLDTAQRLIEDEDWFGAANRLYYAMYQIVSALMLFKSIRIKSHSGAKIMFDLHFVKTGIVSLELGKLYTRLSNARHESDYGPFASFDREDIAPLFLKPKNLSTLSSV